MLFKFESKSAHAAATTAVESRHLTNYGVFSVSSSRILIEPYVRSILDREAQPSSSPFMIRMYQHRYLLQLSPITRTGQILSINQVVSPGTSPILKANLIISRTHHRCPYKLILHAPYSSKTSRHRSGVGLPLPYPSRNTRNLCIRGNLLDRGRRK